ncbi:MAG: serine/threonine protein kinase [Acidobacteria bacterium]|nr:serine/threonine protein kinase [Acidobacteriota bacterium]
MTDDTKPELSGSVAANRYLRRAVDKCLADGIKREQVAEALLRMTETVHSEIAEAHDEYRPNGPSTPEASESIDQVPVGAECGCGWVYSADHHFCSRCGSPLQPSIVPKAVPGRLQFERRLGKGGSGVVYEAVDLSLGRRVAVKTLPTVCSAGDIARLRREAQTLAAVSHRNLAIVYGFKVYRGTPMIIMEFVDGSTLAERIPLPLDVAIEVMLEVTEVVGSLHKARVVHRDIKPRNIAFNSAGDLKLLDFGLARLEREATMSGVGGHFVVGTPAYLSPEAHNHQRANPSFDLWALAVTFFEVLTGRRPFEAGSPECVGEAIREGRRVPISAHLANAPAQLESFFARALALEASARPRDSQELSKRLLALRRTVQEAALVVGGCAPPLDLRE